MRARAKKNENDHLKFSAWCVCVVLMYLFPFLFILFSYSSAAAGAACTYPAYIWRAMIWVLRASFEVLMVFNWTFMQTTHHAHTHT